MSELFEKLTPHLKRSYAFQTALNIITWDNNTLAPREAIDNTAKAIEVLAGEAYGTIINDQVKELLAALGTPGEQEG